MINGELLIGGPTRRRRACEHLLNWASFTRNTYAFFQSHQQSIFTKNQTSLLLTIRSITLHKQLVSAMGR